MDRVISIALDLSVPSEQLSEMIAGCICACSEHEDIKLILLGNEELIKKELSAYGPLQNRIDVIDVSGNISESDALVTAVRDKQDSALVKGLKLVRNGGAGAFLSCLAPKLINDAAQMIIGRIERINISPMTTLVPGLTKPFLVFDSGYMGVKLRPSDFVLFSLMGSLYMRHLSSEQCPVVRLLSDSPIPENGGTLYRDAYELLKRTRETEFEGTIRPAELFNGKADVVVCDGFAGSLILNMISGMVSNLSSGATVKRRHLFGKPKEPEMDAILSTIDISSRGITFFPCLQHTAIALCENPGRETVQRAVGFAKRLVKEDIRARLISQLRL